MTHACELCCDRCGGTAFSHFFGRDRRGQRRWHNRCEACGRVSDYVPTRSEIENQCRELRDQQGQFALDDEHEKQWRRLADAADSHEEAGDRWEEEENAELEIWNGE